MFDIGWSELVVIAVVALIAIGPKELPGVLRMVGQWMGKARKMAAEFQGQFQEAMREAEMADLKKSFDEVKDAATGFVGGNVMTSLQKDVGDALQIGNIDKPADAQVASAVGEPIATSTSGAPTTSTSDAPTTPAEPTPATFVEAEAHAAANEPLAITREVQAAQQNTSPPAEVLKDAKAS
jgi:sec-independent protein translocase protein TatB